MKKIICTTLVGLSVLASDSASAGEFSFYEYNAPKTFEGWYVGGELNTLRYELKVGGHNMKHHGFRSSTGIGANVIGGYGFTFGETDLVGQVQERLGVSSAAVKSEREKLQEQFSGSIAYLQGYRVAERFLPYAKISYDMAYFDTKERFISEGAARGVGFGGGLKYSINERLEVGVEYTRLNIKGKDDIKLKGDNIALNLSHRF